MTINGDAEIRPCRTGRRDSVSKQSIVAEGLRKEFPGGVLAVAGVDRKVRGGFLSPNGECQPGPEPAQDEEP